MLIGGSGAGMPDFFFGRNLKKIGLYYKFLKILKSTGSLRVSRNQWMGKQWTELSGLIPAESVRVWVYAFFCTVLAVV